MLTKLKTTVVALSLLSLLSGCATLDTNKKKIFVSMATGLAAGMLAGAVATPQGDPALAWMALGGSAGMATGAAVGLYLFDEGKVSETLRLENQTLQAQLTELKTQNDPKLVEQGGSLMNAPLPAEAKGLINPGGWKRYKLDRWVQDSENAQVWYRQVEMMEFTIPSLGGGQ